MTKLIDEKALGKALLEVTVRGIKMGWSVEKATKKLARRYWQIKEGEKNGKNNNSRVKRR